MLIPSFKKEEKILVNLLPPVVLLSLVPFLFLQVFSLDSLSCLLIFSLFLSSVFQAHLTINFNIGPDCLHLFQHGFLRLVYSSFRLFSSFALSSLRQCWPSSALQTSCTPSLYDLVMPYLIKISLFDYIPLVFNATSSEVYIFFALHPFHIGSYLDFDCF